MTNEQMVEKNQRRFKQRVAQIREDEDLNEDARRNYLAEAHQAAAAKHSALFEERRSGIAERLGKARKAALQPPHIHGADKAAVSMSYRAALDQVSKEDTADRLQEQLKRAELTGDTVLAKAILFRGYELEDASVVAAYLESFPDDRRAWDEFTAAAEEHNALQHQERMFGQLGPEPPRELGGVG